MTHIVLLVCLALSCVYAKTHETSECNNPLPYPHPTDCTKFLQCAPWGLVEHSCASGTHFNSAIYVCDWPQNAGCQAEQQPEPSVEEVVPEPPPKPEFPITEITTISEATTESNNEAEEGSGEGAAALDEGSGEEDTVVDIGSGNESQEAHEDEGSGAVDASKEADKELPAHEPFDDAHSNEAVPAAESEEDEPTSEEDDKAVPIGSDESAQNPRQLAPPMAEIDSTPNDICKEHSDKLFLTHNPNSSTNFIICYYGKSIVRNCPEGTYYNQSLVKCVRPL